ncbi:MAG: Ig-like domain-containing protein [bacterium]
MIFPACILLLSTCESFPTLPATASSIAAAAVLPATSPVGSVLTAGVIVTDATGNPLLGFPVTFAVASGGGSVNPTTVLTDANGSASALWTLGLASGQHQLVATAGSRTFPFTVTATAGPASQIAASPGTAVQTAAPGAAVPILPSVIVRDARGNPAPGVPVTFTVLSGGGSVTGGTTSTDARGIAVVGSWTLGPVAQTNTLTATSPGLTGSPVTFIATAVATAGTLAVNAGNNQTAKVNTAVGVAPSAVIRDANNNPVVGATVTFAVASGGGSVTGAATQTDGSGVATVGSWTLGPTVGPNTLTATSTFGSATFTATAAAAAPSTLAINAGDGQTSTSGSQVPIPPSVIVKDLNGNPVSGASVTFAVSSGGGSVSASQATTNANGIATVGSWTLGAIAGANSLTASSGSLVPVTFTATGVPGTGVMSVNAGDNQTATANTPVAVAPSVVIRDANNNPVVGTTVTFAVTLGGGSVTGATIQTNGSGVATVGSWTLGAAVGTNTLTATSTFGSVTFTATGAAAPPSTLAINAGDGQTATAGSQVPIPPSVIVKDQNGNPVSGVVVTFTVASGGGSVNASPATTDVNGIATLGSWTLGTIAGANSLTASSGSLAAVTFSATGVTGAGVMSANGGNNQTAPVNTPVPVAPSVVIRDVNNNPVVGAAVTFSVASGGGSVTGATTQTDASGVATVGSWTLGTTVGTNTLTATSTFGSVTFTATATVGAPATLAINAGDGQTSASGSQVLIPPSVIVKDANGNPVSGVVVTFAVTTGGGSVNGSPATTNASGIATVGSWTLGASAGANSLTASSGSLTPVSFSATGTVGTGTLSVNGGNNQNATVNTAVLVNPSVIIKDTNGNPIANVSVTFAVASGGGSVTGATTTTNASGIATVGGWRLGTMVGSNTLTATSSAGGVTFTATGTAGAATQIVVLLGNNQTATVNTAVPIRPSVIVKDAFGNPVAGVPVTFTVTGGGGSVTGGSQTSTSDGGARSGGWTLGTTAGTNNNTLTATSPGLTGASFTASGTAGPATSIGQNAGDLQVAAHGAAVATPPSVIVKDQFGNPVIGVTVVFAIASGGGSVTGASAVTNASGIAAVGSWTLGPLPGPNSLRATSGALTGSPVTFTATGI